MKISNLPYPTEHELEIGQKSEYFNRMFREGQHLKFKISPDQLGNWIHKNYTSIISGEGPLSYEKSQKVS